MEQSIIKLFELYLDCSQMEESSEAIKKRAAKYFIQLFGDMDISKVTYSHAEDYRNWLTKGRKQTSANIYLSNFKPFFSWLVKRRYIELNPFAEVKGFKSQHRIQPFSRDEIARMIMVADERWKPMILLGLAGMRRAEVLNLVVRDIHFDKNYILISSKDDTEYTWRWRIKDHNQRIVPLPERILTADMQLNLHQMLIALIEWLSPGKQPYVFIDQKLYRELLALKNAGKLKWERRNNPWGNFSRDFRKIQKRANVEPRRFHDLRGTFATKMGEHIPLNRIQKLMGHSSPQITARYVKIDEQKLVAESAEILKKCYA